MCLGNRFIDKFWLLCVIWHGTLYSVFLCNFQFYNFSQTSSNSDSLFNFYNNSNNFEKIIFIYAGMKVFMRVSTSVYIPRYVCTYEDTYVSMYHGVLHGVSPPLFYPLPIQRSPSWWETSCVPPPFSLFLEQKSLSLDLLISFVKPFKNSDLLKYVSHVITWLYYTWKHSQTYCNKVYHIHTSLCTSHKRVLYKKILYIN